jgi:Fic family protein
MFSKNKKEFVFGKALEIKQKSENMPDNHPLTFHSNESSILIEASLALGELKGSLELLPESSIFLFNFLRKEALFSLQLEGYQVSFQDLLLYEIQQHALKNLAQVKEVCTYWRAMVFGMNKIRAGASFNSELAKELYCILLGESQLAQASSMQPLFQPMDQLLLELSPYPKLIQSALFHVKWETSFKLPSLGKRLGRILALLILMHAGLLKEPLLALSLYYRTFKSQYEQPLCPGELSSLKEKTFFHIEAISKAAQESTHNLKKLSLMLKEDKESLKSLGKLYPSACAVLEAFAYKPLGNSTYLHQKADISHATLNRVLLELQRLGLVQEITGQKRSRLFIYRNYTELLTT